MRLKGAAGLASYGAKIGELRSTQLRPQIYKIDGMGIVDEHWLKLERYLGNLT